MAKKGHRPIRMCVVCRKRLPKDNLLRLVMISGKIVEDRQCKLQGRGTYVCKDCEELAKKNFKRGGLI